LGEAFSHHDLSGIQTRLPGGHSDQPADSAARALGQGLAAIARRL